MELLRIQILLSNDMCMRHRARMRSFGQERAEAGSGMQIIFGLGAMIIIAVILNTYTKKKADNIRLKEDDDNE